MGFLFSGIFIRQSLSVTITIKILSAPLFYTLLCIGLTDGATSMTTFRRKTLALALAGIITTQLAACGTVFYPERKGQHSGRIDPVVAIANGVGLLFFLVPGVIAFAVDFTNGTIYLPGGRAEHQPELTPDNINNILYAATGKQVDWSQQDITITSLQSHDAFAGFELMPAQG